MRQRTTILLTVALLVVGCAGAFFARAGKPPWSPYRIAEHDSLYHFRLAELTWRSFPRIPTFDPYLDHPDGADVPMPFLHSFAAAAIARAVGGGEDRLRQVCFFLPPLFGAVCLPLVYALAVGMGIPRGAALAGAALSVFSPIHRQYSYGGQFDHHAGDLVLALLFFLGLMACWRRRERSWREPAVLARLAATAGIAALLPANWLGSIVYFVVFLIAALWSGAGAERSGPPGGPWLQRLAACLGVGALLLAGLFLLAYGPGRFGRLAMDRPTAFQPLFLLGIALGTGLLSSIAGGRAAWRLRSSIPWILALLPVAAALGPEFWRGFLVFLSGTNRLSMLSTETTSPFAVGSSPLPPGHSLASGLRILTWAVLVAPLSLAWTWARRGGWAARREFPLALLTVFSFAALAAAFSQARYGVLLAPVLGLWAAAGIGALSPSLRGGWPHRAGGIAGIALIVGSFAPGAADAVRAWPHPPQRDPGSEMIEQAMDWLARHTPAPSDPFDLRQRPAYGIISTPAVANAVIALGRRADMNSAFLGILPGPSRTMPFFLEEDPERAWAFARENRVRYLVLESLPEAVATALYVSGQDGRLDRFLGEGYFSLYREQRVPVVLRLWEGYGSAEKMEGGVWPGSRHFRIVWDSVGLHPAPGKMPRRILIFEVVPGARLAGAAPPGTRIWATLPLAAQSGPAPLWVEFATADAQGKWEMTLPIPTDRESGPLVPRGAWEISRADRTGILRVDLSEDAVREGRAIALP